jgi:hypothetical protein
LWRSFLLTRLFLQLFLLLFFLLFRLLFPKLMFHIFAFLLRFLMFLFPLRMNISLAPQSIEFILVQSLQFLQFLYFVHAFIENLPLLNDLLSLQFQILELFKHGPPPSLHHLPVLLSDLLLLHFLILIANSIHMSFDHPILFHNFLSLSLQSFLLLNKFQIVLLLHFDLPLLFL